MKMRTESYENKIGLFDELEDMVEDFPAKDECNGSLLRKRRTGKIVYYKVRRNVSINSLYGYLPVDREGKWTDENPVYYKRVWRGKRSKYIKKQCSRRYRKKHRLHMDPDLSVSRCKGIKHRETEFWWELD